MCQGKDLAPFLSKITSVRISRRVMREEASTDARRLDAVGAHLIKRMSRNRLGRAAGHIAALSLAWALRIVLTWREAGVI